MQSQVLVNLSTALVNNSVSTKKKENNISTQISVGTKVFMSQK